MRDPLWLQRKGNHRPCMPRDPPPMPELSKDRQQRVPRKASSMGGGAGEVPRDPSELKAFHRRSS
eukprot:5625046-Alexandrium_andersonii.AAC.1